MWRKNSERWELIAEVNRGEKSKIEQSPVTNYPLAQIAEVTSMWYLYHLSSLTGLSCWFFCCSCSRKQHPEGSASRRLSRRLPAARYWRVAALSSLRLPEGSPRSFASPSPTASSLAGLLRRLLRASWHSALPHHTPKLLRYIVQLSQKDGIITGLLFKNPKRVDLQNQ